MKVARIIFWVFMVLCGGLLLAPLAPALAGGPYTPPSSGGGAVSSSGAVAGAISGAGALATSDLSGIGGSGGAATTTNKTTAYAVGGTGLTSTPPGEHGPAQGSASIAFGAFATTFVSESAAGRWYARELCPKEPDPQACRKKAACLDDELGDGFKAMLGCPGVE